MTNIPPQTGRVAVVTGATSGIGYHTVRGLAGAGAEVVLAVRDVARGERALAEIGAAAVVRLDLADQASVRTAAAELLDRGARRVSLDDVARERRYHRWPVYSETKLANLLFMFELGRRAAAAGLALT